MTSHSFHGPENSVQENCVIVRPLVGKQTEDLAAAQEEIEGLACAIHLNVEKTIMVNVSKIQAGSFLGKGQRENIRADIEIIKPQVVIVDHTLSPVQQRNLEKEWHTKVIDRTALILEIFGDRAQTKEGRLQVDLAALEYQKSRLVRSWTHLERQRGGAGFMGGPGERQIEIDRRLIDQRITKLKKQLENVRRTRDLGRQSRARVPFPIITLVGYTNAGKSTLFNALTDSDVFAEDLPFATLDPTLRRISLPSGKPAILSDTVGFISDLPTHLIAAFRATLEQITQADVILHVIDASRPDCLKQKEDVVKILKELGIEEEDSRIFEVWNKADKLDEDSYTELCKKTKFNDQILIVSAVKEEGLEDLLSLASDFLAQQRLSFHFTIPIGDGKAISWLYEHGEIVERSDGETETHIDVLLEPEDLDKYQNYFGYQPKKGA